MKRDDLLKKLNWFYTLEINQVELYLGQSNVVKDKHLAKAFRKFALIEQGHVDSIRTLIEEMGETPTIIGEVIAEATGITAGKISSFVTIDKILQLDITLERKAISDYMMLINEVNDENVCKQLYNNMLDEELHTAWMKERLGRNKMIQV